LHSKGSHGTPLSGGALGLSLVEAAYLVEAGRLKVRRGASLVRLEEVLLEGAKDDLRFELRYLVYRDFRERGFVVREEGPAARIDFSVRPRGAPAKAASKSWVLAVSERSAFKADEVLEYVERAEGLGKQALVAVVDEEGDITHYSFAPGLEAHRGSAPALPKARGVLSGNHVLVAGEGAAAVHEADPLLGKALKHLLRLSLMEAAYLASEGKLVVSQGPQALSDDRLIALASRQQPDFADRLAVYRALRSRGLTPKTGFKYGAHFRVYDRQAGSTHARYLVQVVPRDYAAPWPEIARAVRLSHGVRKRLVLALSGGPEPSFLEVAWVRP
jgi:tRNA-intron endonuclease